MKKLNILFVLTFIFSLATVSYGFNKAEVITKNINEDSKENRFEIRVKYPQIKYSDSKMAKRFNNKVVSLVKEKVSGFKKNAIGIETERKESGSTSTVGYDLTIDFQTEMIGENYVSISFGESTYLGGAHPNFQSYSINYDLKNGREFGLRDMFKKNVNYLKLISDYSILQLSKKQGERTDWIERGAAAKEDNFDSWTVSNYGLKFTFDPYQVGSYAAGSFEVVVPYEVLSKNMRSPLMQKIVSDINTAAMQAKSVRELYLMMPTKFSFVVITPEKAKDKAAIEKIRRSWIVKEDLQNGYLKVKTPDNPNPNEIIAIDRGEGKYTVVFTDTVTDATGTYGFVNFYAYEDGEWIDWGNTLFPKLSDNYINAAVAHKNIKPKYGNVGAYYLLSPNTVSLACRTCNDGKEIILQEFKWDGLKFSSKDSFAMDSNPKNVKDYFLAMPMDGYYSQAIDGKKYNDATKLKQFREKFVEINDTKNGYLRLLGINEGWGEVALFKKNDGGYLIGVTESGCGPSCEGVINFYTYGRGKWTDVTDKVFPEITEKFVTDMFNAKDVLTVEWGEQYYYLLPRNGTTVKAACNMCKNGDGKDFTLKEFTWDGEKFSVKN